MKTEKTPSLTKNKTIKKNKNKISLLNKINII